MFLGYDDSLDHVPQQRWLRALARGRPLAFRSNDVISLLGAARALRRVGAAGPPVERELWLLVHPDLRRSVRVRVAVDFLVELVGRERALIAGQCARAAAPGAQRPRRSRL